jgi:hypothetical protein
MGRLSSKSLTEAPLALPGNVSARGVTDAARCFLGFTGMGRMPTGRFWSLEGGGAERAPEGSSTRTLQCRSPVEERWNTAITELSGFK